jgi:hypothetical protein
MDKSNEGRKIGRKEKKFVIVEYFHKIEQISKKLLNFCIISDNMIRTLVSNLINFLV